MTLLSSARAYTGRIIHVDRDTVQFPTGSTGVLEMIRHPGAAAVVPFLDDPSADNPRILLLRQFRHAADDYIWEVPAGTLDPGESPEACARREVEEEAGVAPGRLEHLTTIFTTPGFTDERIHLFLAQDLIPRPSKLEHDEVLTVHPIAWSEVGRMIRRREIVDGKTLATLMYMQCFRRG